jgi:hypothetical protein
MKIIVLGGYGIFGGRLCHLLATDPRLVIFVAGRSYNGAEAFCRSLPPGAAREPLAFDRDKDINQKIQQVQPDLIIDASGPFQAYGSNPYRLVEACLANGVNYMDFADGSDFVKGICRFDEQAKSKNLFVLSGVSSFPVLTAAVVRRLSSDLDKIKSIRGGIAPSPYAGVGMNVVRAISAYAGKPVRLVRNGQPTFVPALTEGMRYTISPPGRLPLNSTYFSLVDVPDLQVLPELWPELENIWMGAGPVPEVLHRMLNSLAWLVRLRILPSLSPFAPLFFRVINILRWGEHRGGMFVEIEGFKRDGAKITRSWHLLAEGNDGPFIPCMALQAVIMRTLDGNRPVAGARPASKDLELDDYERLFERRTIFTGQRESVTDNSARSIFKTLLGTAWSALPSAIQDMHDSEGNLRMAGVAMVERGKGWLARFIAILFQFPADGDDVVIDVLIKKSAGSETWIRTFAGRSFSSVISLGRGRSDNLLSERFGLFSFDLALVVDNGILRFVVRRWKLWRIPLPSAWAPCGDSYECSRNGRFCFDIEIRHSLAGLIVKYSGSLAPAIKGNLVKRAGIV